MHQFKEPKYLHQCKKLNVLKHLVEPVCLVVSYKRNQHRIRILLEKGFIGISVIKGLSEAQGWTNGGF